MGIHLETARMGQERFTPRRSQQRERAKEREQGGQLMRVPESQANESVRVCVKRRAVERKGGRTNRPPPPLPSPSPHPSRQRPWAACLATPKRNKASPRTSLCTATVCGFPFSRPTVPVPKMVTAPGRNRRHPSPLSSGHTYGILLDALLSLTPPPTPCLASSPSCCCCALGVPGLASRALGMGGEPSPPLLAAVHPIVVGLLADGVRRLLCGDGGAHDPLHFPCPLHQPTLVRLRPL